jgi:hypothetical protein
MLTPCTLHPAPYTLHLIHICAFVTLGQFLKYGYVRRDENIATTQSTFEKASRVASRKDFKSGI